MRRIKYILFILLFTFILSACSDNNKEGKENESIEEISEEKIDAKDYSYIDNGGFYINNKGEGVKKSEVDDKKIIYWYFDPKCPYCIMLEQETSSYLFEIMGDNTLIKYMPLSFLGRPKDEDTNNRVVTYSDMITGIIVSIAENDPNLAYDFMKKVLDESFINDLSKLDSIEKQDQMVKDIYEKDLKGLKWDKIVKNTDTSRKTVYNLTTFTSQNEELKAKTPDGNIKVPLLLKDGDDKIIPVLENEDNIRGVLEEYLK